MAKRKKARNPELSAVEKEYRRIRNNYLKYLRTYQKKGYISNVAAPVAIPKEITQGSLNRINREYNKLKETVASRKQGELDVIEVVDEFINDAIKRAEDSSTLQGLRISKSMREYLNVCIRKYGKKNYYKALLHSPNAIIEAMDAVLFYKGVPTDTWGNLNTALYNAAKSLETKTEYPEGVVDEEVRSGDFKFHVKGETEQAIRKIMKNKGFTKHQSDEYIDNEYQD